MPSWPSLPCKTASFETSCHGQEKERNLDAPPPSRQQQMPVPSTHGRVRVRRAPEPGKRDRVLALLLGSRPLGGVIRIAVNNAEFYVGRAGASSSNWLT